MNARIAGHAGTGRQLTLVMVNTSMFRHPKYYKELRKLRNKSDQAISLSPGDGQVERSTGPGLKPGGPQISVREFIRRGTRGPRQQAPSTKPQASSTKLLEPQAASVKPQA